jgi:Mg-chelatase subunit ChlD
MTGPHDIAAGGGPGPDDEERRRRWRLLLGAPAEPALGPGLGRRDAAIDAVLAALYDSPPPEGGQGGGPTAPRRAGGLQGSAPRVARWLGDIRTYFPSSVVQVLQRDAVERLGLTRLLLEPELLEAVQPDVHLVGTLLALGNVIPEATKATARQVVAQVVVEIERRVGEHTRSTVTGALDRASRASRPPWRAVDWDRTIRANLVHYLPEHRTVVPARLIGHGRRQQAVARDVILAIDQSGSMAESVVYASVFGSVLASMRSLRTSLVVFDTAVVDLSDQLHDPVEVLFGVQLGGGTDINRAVAYCSGLVTRPRDTLMLLVSDLYEGGDAEDLVRRVAALTAAGVQVIVLLALADGGTPSFDRENAAALASLGVPAFAVTPDLFPDALAVALRRGDVEGWAQRNAAAAAVLLPDQA